MEQAKETLDIKHWLSQIIPPLLVLCSLFLTNSGSALILLAGLFVIPALISIISVIVKLIRFKKRKYYLIRPFLTIAFFFVILIVAQWTYNIALDQAINAAEIISGECNRNSVCPENPDGWKTDDSRVSRNDLGLWFKYSASYRYDPQSFIIQVYRGPDMGNSISGGVGIPLNVARYIEN